MALLFTPKETRVRAKHSDSNKQSTVRWVTSTNFTPTAAAAAINKLFYIADQAVVADESMIRTTIEGVLDNG